MSTAYALKREFEARLDDVCLHGFDIQDPAIRYSEGILKFDEITFGIAINLPGAKQVIEANYMAALEKNLDKFRDELLSVHRQRNKCGCEYSVHRVENKDTGERTLVVRARWASDPKNIDNTIVIVQEK